MNRTSKRITALGTATVAVMGAGVAVAAWTASGSGTGASQALTAVASTVTADTATASLYPGGPAGAVFFTIDNKNPYNVSFDKITAISVVSDNTTACPASKISVPTVPAGGLAITAVNVPANTTTAVSKSIPGLVSLDASALDGCQGATFTTTLTLAGSQV